MHFVFCLKFTSCILHVCNNWRNLYIIKDMRGPGWPETCYRGQTDLELRNLLCLSLPLGALELKAMCQQTQPQFSLKTPNFSHFLFKCCYWESNSSFLFMKDMYFTDWAISQVLAPNLWKYSPPVFVIPCVCVAVYMYMVCVSVVAWSFSLSYILMLGLIKTQLANVISLLAS